MATGLAVVVLSILTAPGIKAQCSAGAHSRGTLAPALRSLQEPAALDQADFSDQAGWAKPLDKEKNDSNVTILGFWKNIYFSDGIANDIGFRQFNAGGTELLNDSPVPSGGNNFCMGAWTRTGSRTYELIHTFFVFESSPTPVRVAIEHTKVTVSRDGNRFKGTWTQDDYDLTGNLVPGHHFDGTLTGERISTELTFPFPFPF
jgi:hypothetical protein